MSIIRPTHANSDNPAVRLLLGRRSDDPQSPAYTPSLFGPSVASKQRQHQAMQQLKRYEALKRRNERKMEAAEAQVQPTSSATLAPSSIPYEEYKALEEKYEIKLQELQSEYELKLQKLQAKYETLEEDYRLRVEELKACKGPLLGRGFPDEAMLKEDQGRSNEFESGEATSGNLVVFHGSKNYLLSSVTCMLAISVEK